MESSKPINLDEESLVLYFVDGIPDSKVNKAGLYLGKSIKELKDEVFIYEQIRGNFLRKCFKYNSEGRQEPQQKRTHL